MSLGILFSIYQRCLAGAGEGNVGMIQAQDQQCGQCRKRGTQLKAALSQDRHEKVLNSAETSSFLWHIRHASWMPEGN